MKPLADPKPFVTATKTKRLAIRSPQSVGCHHPTSTSEVRDRSRSFLKSAGLKLTASRAHLIDVMSRLSMPFTVEKVHAMSNRKGASGCDLVTVYRTLATMHKLGLLTRVDLNDGITRYEFTGPNDHHHHHFVCRECGAISTLDFCSSGKEIETFEASLRQSGYSDVSHRLEFVGRCPRCANDPTA